jgi:hypothetical protein
MVVVTLETEGYEVLEAGDGRSALETIAGHRPDLVVLDYVLPDMDGLALLGEVRRRTAAPELPVLLVTGMVSRLDELRARGGGFAEVLPKPLDPSRLLEVVRAHLSVPEVRGRGRSLLVVDDEPLNLKLAAVRLKHAGFEVLTASGGEEGLEFARRRLPAAILADVSMPSMDGFSLCMEARRDPQLAAIPVVLTSAVYIEEADRELARKAGASALVLRTADLGEAIKALEDCLLAPGSPLPPAGPDLLNALHRERLQVQLDRQMAGNKVLAERAAIQAAALSVMRGLSQALAHPKEAPKVVGDVLVYCLDATGLSTGLLYVMGAGGRPRLEAQFGISADRKADAEDSFGHADLIHRIVETGQPAAFSSGTDVANLEARDFLSRLGHSSALMIPFMVLAESFGVLVLASDTHDLSKSTWMGFAGNLATQFGQTVALGQSLTRLATSESRYRALMEQANDAILILDVPHRILEVNQEAVRLLGYPRGRLVGRHYDELVVPEEREDSAERQEAFLAEGTMHVPGRNFLRADGSTVPVDVSASLVRLGDEAGESVVVAILRDVTERNRAEEARMERARLATFAADISVALSRPDDLRNMLEACAQAMVDHLGAAFARVWTLNVDENVLELQASAGMYTHIDGAHARVPVGRFKIGMIAQEREPHFTNDVLNDPRLSDPEWARREGMVAFAGHPLMTEGELVGVAALFARRPLDEFTLTALANAADSIALAIKRKAAAADLQRKDDELRRAQQRLHHVVSSSPTVLYSLRPEGQAFSGNWVSDNVERLLGYTPAEVLRPEWWSSNLHHDDRERILADLPRLLAEGSLSLEYRFRLKHGGYRWLRDEIVLLRDAAGNPAEAVGSWSDVAARKEAELRLLDSEAQYRLLFEGNPHPMWVFDAETLAFLAVNEAAIRHYGYSRGEFLGMTIRDIRPPEDVQNLLQSMRETSADRRGPDVVGLFRHWKKDRSVIQVEIASSPIKFQGREARLVLAMDVTEKRSLEAQLLQSQKMESVGRLAGGVAHDFNNILGVITGYGELLRKRLPDDSPLQKYADDVLKAAHRAAGLTRQLLAFSRRQVLQPRVLDLNGVVSELEKMLRRLIGEDVRLVVALGQDPALVLADPGHLEQVLMNLVVNARDAMPQGGRLTIETGRADLDERYAALHPGVLPGRYAMLAVSDTGHGMSREVQARIFEPFFTTKDPGKGTGLGLATVHGIMRQSGGHIFVYSEPGQGSAFKVYLPLVEGLAKAGPLEKEQVEAPSGTETVLLVEDEASLRAIIRECLEEVGYRVLEAADALAALEVEKQHPEAIQLLITDVVMPGLGGRELAERLTARRPGIRVLYMSGYTDDAVILHGVLTADMPFLEKPFTPGGLARKVREVLDRM